MPAQVDYMFPTPRNFGPVLLIAGVASGSGSVLPWPVYSPTADVNAPDSAPNPASSFAVVEPRGLEQIEASGIQSMSRAEFEDYSVRLEPNALRGSSTVPGVLPDLDFEY